MTQISPTQIVIYIIGLFLMLSVLIIGPNIEPDIKQLGLSAYLRETQWRGAMWLFGFVFLLPAGLLVCTVAGLLINSLGWRVLLVMLALGIAIASLVVVWPPLVGKEGGTLYFGIGGTILLVLISGTGWYWAQQRQQTIPSLRRSIDLRGIAYFCFAMATWHSCGAGGLPGFAIYPESAITVKHYPFIIGQFKALMLYFILAWSCLLLSYYFKKKKI